MKIKTCELIGKPLDWAVARALGYDEWDGECFTRYADGYSGAFFICNFRPTIDWAEGGPIIEREKIEWQWLPASDKAHQYGARKPSLGGLNRTFCMDGPTVLIAAMRCYVASKLGDKVEVPDEVAP